MEGPRKRKLREAKQQVETVHHEGVRGGTASKIPRFEEGRMKGTIAEIYYMHHMPSGKGYVGMAYHGSLDRMKTLWTGRNREGARPVQCPDEGKH